MSEVPSHQAVETSARQRTDSGAAGGVLGGLLLAWAWLWHDFGPFLP
jgi:hypothetical protein